MDVWTKRLSGIIYRLVLVLFCGSHGTSGQEVCDVALLSNLSPSSFRSSSQLSSSHAAGFARLNRRDGAGGWSPLLSDSYQWLQVDLGERTKITAVATQGRYGSSDWLSSYLLMFSDTGHNWRQYRQEDSVGSFPGNSNADSVVQNKLQQPVVARFLRLIPLDWNHNGRIGLRLETYGCTHTSAVVGLDSSRVGLVFRFRPGSKTSREVLSLRFKTQRNGGRLLRAEGDTGPGFSLELERATVQLMIRTGKSSSEPLRLASLGSLLDDQHWHHLALERRGSHLNLTVDKHTERVQIPAEFSHWDIQQLTVGSGQDIHSKKTEVSKTNFHGCLENLQYNGLNLIELAKIKDPQVTVVGNVTFSCAEPVSVAVTFPGPRSFLRLPGAMVPSSPGGVSVGFQFRTWNKAGLLLTFDLWQEEGGVAWLYLRDARLHLQVHRAGRAPLELSAGSALNDGQWHSVELSSKRGRLSVAVDTGEGGGAHASSSINIGPQLFFGGCPPEEEAGHECRNPFEVFRGCMRLIAVDDRPVDLILVQQRLLGNYSHLQIDMCGIIDRCSPSRCEHGGVCSQSWTVFHCNCSGSGYSGATCHSSVYEQSCEAYKHNGNTSGHFYIDVDGSGPIRPQLVYCNMTEEKTWMVIQHNNTELTRVRPSPGVNQHSVHFDYAAEEEQLLAAIGQSEHCEQELTYRCRKSRLLNTPEGSPFSWFRGGPGRGGQVQSYWSGAQPDSQQCSCGLQGDCVDPQHYCNCDADRTEWTEDSGLVTHNGSLPIRSLVLGDVSRPGSEAAYRVGPLRCHGDKNLWNAAFFDKETSYLHFPTFQGELSADISFLFKTTADSGVFLENLGIRDFIRIELSSPTRVLLSLDVGDGPLQLWVESPRRLNDNVWHRVRAERTVKEARLQLEQLPVATQEAPADGHLHLQLNSQLFIGGTASRLQGFRGCLRSLQLNGVTLDLEQRARVTPGVAAGCPGHCSSYGALCGPQGRCVERDRGFSCDCGGSAYTGAFCSAEVSAIFASSTSVVYELSRNSSALPSDTTLRAENVSLSFRTNQSPAVLLYVSSFNNEYLALVINKHDMLEVIYKLDGSREADVLRSRVRNLADGQLHSVSVRRVTHSVSVQIDQNASEEFNLTSDGELNGVKSLVLGKVHDPSLDLDPDLSRVLSLGFSGCLSVVRLNSISPLKAAVLRPHSVSITGPLVQSHCGSTAGPYAAENTLLKTDHSGSVSSGQPLVNAIRTDSALIGGVIAVVIFVLLVALAVGGRLLYRRKETFRSQEVKEVRQEDSQDFHFNTQEDSHNNGPPAQQHTKEYFI